MFDAIDQKLTELEGLKSSDPKRWRYSEDKPVRKYRDGPEDGHVAELRSIHRRPSVAVEPRKQVGLTMQTRTEVLGQQRTVVAERLEVLRLKRGAAVYDDQDRGKLDAEIARAEADLAGIEDARAEAAHRERAALSEREAQALARDRDELRRHYIGWLEACDQAEQSTLDLVSAARESQFAAKEIDRLVKAVRARAGGQTNASLSPIEMEQTLSNMIGGVLMGIANRNQFGTMTFKSAPSLKPHKQAGFRDAEEKRIGSAIKIYTGEV